MGTFIVKALSVTGNDITHWNDHGVSGVGTILVANDNKYTFWSYGAAGNPVSASYRANTSSSASIYLDGSGTPVDFNHLPAGFVVTSAEVDWFGQNSPDATSSFFTQASATLETKAVTTGVNVTNKYIYTFPLNMLSVVNNGMGVRGFADNGAVAQVDRLQITGNYNIVSTSWTLTPTTNVKNGDPVTITDSAASPLLANVISAVVNYGSLMITIPKSYFDVQTPTKLVLFLPNIGNFSGTVYIHLVGDGFEFTGSALAGSFTTLVSAGMGIYQIIPGQLYDQVYNPGGGNATTNIQIPNIFAKTGFIGG